MYATGSRSNIDGSIYDYNKTIYAWTIHPGNNNTYNILSIMDNLRGSVAIFNGNYLSYGDNDDIGNWNEKAKFKNKHTSWGLSIRPKQIKD